MRKIKLGYLVICCLAGMINKLTAQEFISSTPAVVLRPVATNTVTISLSGHLEPVEFFIPPFSWSVTPSTGVTINHPDNTIAPATASFSSAANGVYTFKLSRGIRDTTIQVTVGNLAAASNGGLDVSVFNVLNGVMLSGSGPAFMYDPLPDPFTTAALGVAINGYYYFMPNTGNTGNVTLYAATPNGQNINAVATIDLNGSSNNNLGFVRLAIDPTGKGWMLAGDGSTVYLANFIANGLSPTSINVVDASVTVVGSSPSVFQNGDLCFSGTGGLYALANNGSGVTQIFTGVSAGTFTVLTKKWDLVDAAGNNFTGNVNGVAFDFLGSLYISTGGATGGLYYINQNTVNTATGTVQCSQVWSGTGLTDLASNLFPAQTALPMKLISFSGRLNNNQVSLVWETEQEQNSSHFEIQRSDDGNAFATVGHLQAAGNSSVKREYRFTESLVAFSQSRFNYRLKIFDRDGTHRFSNVIFLRKQFTGPAAPQVVPNPAKRGEASVQFYSGEETMTTIRIIDLSGRIVLQQQAQAYKGLNSIALTSTEHLRCGSYFLQLASGEIVKTTRFVVTD